MKYKTPADYPLTVIECHCMNLDKKVTRFTTDIVHISDKKTSISYLFDGFDGFLPGFGIFQHFSPV